MSIFKNESSLEILRKKSADALRIFQSTVSNLQETNKDIEKEEEIKSKEIQKLRDEHIELTKMKYVNESIIDKINDFMGSI